ncbi:30S ribosomal protein S7 [candidate division WWE3 bacterium RIFOXYC1_FULL_42_13]|uniref:Small ribosomal subunit protein uS7 n=1 Tax=candidate division WWE3 bacterium GW2011_GWB1_42_6 TaxID=1619115 RepID=A0A0G1D7G9_UNCKA|nr:MAG: 30S ribosomal protein S7 [candidate division WWE3 bacterium GW2011_GWA1_42_12]KKS66796.1 MAG: 30S ribosomal protein S7 [candidate division WWE3 bacterium GW2011_GWB1_42_6]OGC58878.1 MAG: 30S ribosomal protein S7 [candidate division WWE3 bacterium RIFOXYA1_FULL_42_9]OGC72480.1 MAG: 30S ribosomal protein S7 [candidate division WWE3 bacterium RIFOXYC1_FULL_42_13]
MRGKPAKKRVLLGDPVFKSKIVNRMINVVMLDGKKSVAESVVYGAIDRLNEDRKEGLRMFETAVKNVMPQQEVRSKRVGGATYQVPIPLKHERSEALALRWLITAARNKKGKPMEEKLYEELNNAYQSMGDAIKKRDDTHRMADANRAFAHFARR